MQSDWLQTTGFCALQGKKKEKRKTFTLLPSKAGLKEVILRQEKKEKGGEGE